MVSCHDKTSKRPPKLLAFRTSTAFIAVTVAFAIFTDVFVYGVIVPVIPFALTQRADVHESDVQYWTSVLLAIYGAALLLTAPICGFLADRSSSRRSLLLLGLLALAGSTILLCVGQTVRIIAAGRVLQGMSAALVWVVGSALLVDTVGHGNIGQMMGYIALAVSLSVLLGPLLGAIVFERAGYRSVWAMTFGLIGVDIVLRLTMIERKIACRWDPRYQSKRADLGEKVLAVTDSVGSDAESNRKATSKTSAEVQASTIRETNDHGKRRDRMPTILRLLMSRRLLSALFAVLVQSSLLTSFDSVLPLFAKNTLGWNATGAGLIFLPFVVPTFLGPFIGLLSDKHGPRWYATAGFVGCCPSVILLRLVDHNSSRQRVLLCALLALVGLFLTLALTPLMAEITYAVAEMEDSLPKGYWGQNGAYAQAYSLFNIAWAAGCMLGPLLSGLIVDSRGWSTATLILGCVSIFTVLPVVIWTGGSFYRRGARVIECEAKQ